MCEEAWVHIYSRGIASVVCLTKSYLGGGMWMEADTVIAKAVTVAVLARSFGSFL